MTLTHMENTQTSHVFDNKALVTHLNNHKISYHWDKSGLIDITPEKDGSIRTLDIRGFDHIDLDILRSSGSIYAEQAKTFRALNWERANGAVNIPNTESLIAPDLQEVTGEFMADFVDARSAKTVDLRSVKSITGNLKINHSQNPRLDNLESVGRLLFADQTTIFHADKLKKAGYIAIENATDLRLSAIEESKTIYMNRSFIGGHAGNLVFSERIGSREAVSIFNQNTGLVKIGCRQWQSVDNARDIVQEKYPTGKYNEEYNMFFDKIAPKIK